MIVPMAKLLYWDALANERVLINKDAALMACVRLRGPDLHSALDSALVVQADQLNNIVMRYGAGWGLQCELRRQEVCAYPAQTWRHHVAALIDAERRERFLTPGLHYANTATLTLTYKPEGVSSVTPRWQHWLYRNIPDVREEAHVGRFEEQIRRTVGMLSDCCEEVTWLEDEALMTYLHSTVSWKSHTVAVPDPPCYLDTYLPDTDLERVWVLPHMGRWPKLGTRYLRCVSVKSYPKKTHPGMLEVLDDLPLEYRACIRFLPLDRQKAITEARKYGDSHYGKRNRKGGSTGRVEQIALDYSQEASDFQRGIEHGDFSSGACTQTVVVWDDDFAGATEKAEQVEQALNVAKYVAKVEGPNTMAAWDSTLPGNRVANPRQPTLTSVNVSHIFPATQQTQGPAWNKHLQGPPLLMTTGRGQTPFALDLHDDDVGHTMIIGPTGTGKSTLLALLCLQWLRYGAGGAQVFAFDKDESLRCTTYAVGGQWFDLGREIERTQAHGGIHMHDSDFQPWGSLWTPPSGWWQCFETASLFSTPELVPKVLGPLTRQLETQLTGVPTLMSFDEGWRYLQEETFQNKIGDYLLTLRKANAVVVFSTQNLEHIVKSKIGSDIFQSCVSKIFLANKDALTPGVGKLYADLGLNDRQRHLIATLARKRQYYYMGAHGHCVFELGLGPVTLAFTGSGRKEDLAAMARLYDGDGARFTHDWLRHKQVEEAAEALRPFLRMEETA